MTTENRKERDMWGKWDKHPKEEGNNLFIKINSINHDQSTEFGLHL